MVGQIFNRTSQHIPFAPEMVEIVWMKGIIIPGIDPNMYRSDVCGATIKRTDYNKTTLTGWEIDHINPLSNGGTDDDDNLQPLQWENNRYKGNTYPHWSCRNRPLNSAK